jgi:subtilase family serine protease
MAIFFNPSAAQQQQLQQLLADQQNPASPNYHKWLTPEQYGERFGMAQADLATVSAWLQAHGFQNVSTSRSRTSIEFDGTAAHVQAAFRTPMHRFLLNGKTHYANTAEPSLPSAFAGSVAGITSLNDFRPRPMSVAHYTSSISGKHFLAPGDVGVIYNVKSLYDSGIDGSGQTIAVVGQTPLTQNDDGTHADIDTFRSLASLPAINLQQINLDNVKYSSADVDEANLDIEWTGAIAPKAQIIFVYSSNALFTSLPDIVNNNRAPVISVSYGSCEADYAASDIKTLTNITQQANAQGQTVVVASGDSGAADCDGTAAKPATVATHGLAVDVPAALQNVTAMGGTQFSGDASACPPNDTCSNGVAPDTPYWKGSNSKTDNSPSALSYIPEVVWNSTSATAIAAGGGGLSKQVSRSSWQPAADFQATANPTSLSMSRGGSAQVTLSITDSGQRAVPDISLTSSPDHDGYLICSQGSCVNGYRRADDTLNVIGGTSAASPVFSGVVVLMNQKFGSRQGNVNPTLYALAPSSPSAFHDITSGNNKVPCTMGTTDCPNGGTIGYSAGTGYDLASGLGSIDVGGLVAAWQNSTTPPSTQFPGTITFSCSVSSSLGTTTCSVSPSSVSTGQNATATITATSSSGLGKAPLPWGRWSLEAAFGVAALCFVPTRRNPRPGRKILNRIAFLALMLLLPGLVSCGGGGGGGNSNSNGGNTSMPLSGSVTVTATSSSLNHSITIPVTIN